MYDNDPAIIDLQIQIDEQGAERSVDSFVKGLRGKLAQLQSMINNARVSDDDRKVLQERQQFLSNLVEEMSSFVEKTHEAGDKARELNRQIREMGKVMKGQVVSGYENTTAEMFEETKAAAKDARIEYQKLNNELGDNENVETLSAINEALHGTVSKLSEMEMSLQHSKGVNAFDALEKDAEKTEEDLKRAAIQAEAYALALEKAKAAGRDQPTAFEAKQIEKQLLENEKRAEEEKLRLEKAQEEAIKRENAAHRQQIQALNEEKRRIKEGASQYYYRLRAIKMLDHVLEQVNGSLDKFAKKSISVAARTAKLWFKLATPFGLISGAIKKATDSLKRFNSESKKAKKSHDSFLDSMKHGVWTIIKYTFGIRSLYFLFNKLRRALSTGMENLATQYDHVNQQMSSVVSSIERMKNAVAAMVQPLLNVLAPALEKISELFANLAYNVASFFATLTGQPFVYYAKKIKKGYIEDKKAAKEYNDEVDRQLSNLDKLNVLTSPKDKKKDEEESPVADMFDVRKISPKALDWLKKLKDFFKPLIDAWNKMKDYVIKSWKYALAQLKALFQRVWKDFLKVWFEDAQTFFEKIFKIIGNIGMIIGNLAKNILKAWEANDNGYRILKAISGILIAIADGIMRCTDLMVEWSERLDFEPLFTAIADVLTDQVLPAVKKVIDLFVVLFRDVVLELARYFIEDFGPIVVRVFGNLVEAVGNLALKFRQAWESNGLGKTIIADIERIMNVIGQTLLAISKKTKDWAAGLDFEPLLASAHKLLIQLQPLISWLVDTLGRLWTEVLLPIGKEFIEKKLPKMMDTIGDMVSKIDMDKLHRATDKLLGLIKKFWDKYGDVMLSVVTKIVDKLVEFINSGKLEKWLDKISEFIDKIDPDKLADWIIRIGEAWIVVRTSSGIIEKITTSLSGLWTAINFFRQWKMVSQLKNISKALLGVKGSIDAVKGAAGAVKAGSELAKAAELATEAYTTMSDAALAAGSASTAAAATAAIVGVTVVKHFQEVEDAAKGGNGAISELGTGLHSLSEILLENGSITEEQSEQLFKDIEQWESWGLSAEQASGKLVLALHDMGVSSDEAVSALAKVYGQNELTTDSYYTLDNALSTLTTTQKESSAEIGNAVQTNVTNYEELVTALFEVGEQMGLSEDQLIAIRDCSDEVYDSTGSMTDAYDEMIEAVRASGGDINEFIRLMNVDLPEGVRTGAGAVVDEMGTLPTYMKDGFENGWNEEFGANGEKVAEDTKFTWSGLIKSIKDALGIDSPSKVFAEIGKFLIQGLVNGIKALTNAPVNAITSVGNAVINKAKSVLSPSKLVSIGKNLLSGLASGIRSGVGNALSAITSAAGSVIDAAKRKFQVHSPSKIFEDIGKMLDEGLAVGVDKNTDDVTDAFDNMVPDNQFLELFYEKFTGMLSSLREESVSIVESMIDEIESAIARMDNLAMLESLSTQLSNIGSIKIPDIAVGAKVPDNEKFAQTQTVDLSSLPKMLKSAFIEAFAETSSLQTSDSGDIIVEMNGYELLRAVRDENTKYKKQTGRSAFA